MCIGGPEGALRRCRLLAKVAADMRKPDGQHVVAGDGGAISHFVQPLPIRKVPGIGKVPHPLEPLVLKTETECCSAQLRAWPIPCAGSCCRHALIVLSCTTPWRQHWPQVLP